MWKWALGCWVLSGVGFWLAFHGVPDAANMGVGCLIVAVVMTVALVWPV